MFSGADRLSLGFDKAGFENVLAVKYDKKIATTQKNSIVSFAQSKNLKSK
ncbi:DNA cytosine methyltransferase [Leuconostoc suionicum]